MSIILKNIEDSYVLLLDGVTEEIAKSWIDEQVYVLRNHDDVFACAVGGDNELPHDFKIWKTSNKKSYQKFIEGVTSTICVLFRKDEFIEMLDHFQEYKLSFKPVNLYDFCYIGLQKRWAKLRGVTYGPLQQSSVLDDIDYIKENMI